MTKQNTIGLKEYTDAELLSELVDRGVIRDIVDSAKITGSIKGVDNIGIVLSTVSVMTKKQNQRISQILGESK